MCYTAKDSIIAYIINLISSIILFKNAKNNKIKVISLFFLFVGQMQIFDYIFWLNQQKSLTNKITTKIAILFNHLQPIVLFALLSYYNFSHSKLSLVIFGLYLIVSILYTIKALKEIDYTLPSKDNIMDWRWNKMNGLMIMYGLFVLTFTISFFDFNDFKYATFLTFINIVSLIIATKTPVLNFSSGRIWCYYASLIPIIIHLIYNK